MKIHINPSNNEITYLGEIALQKGFKFQSGIIGHLVCPLLFLLFIITEQQFLR